VIYPTKGELVRRQPRKRKARQDGYRKQSRVISTATHIKEASPYKKSVQPEGVKCADVTEEEASRKASQQQKATGKKTQIRY